MAAAYKFIVCLSEIESPLFAKPNFSRLLHRLLVLMKGYAICFSNRKNWNIGQMIKPAVIPIRISNGSLQLFLSKERVAAENSK